jgi:branched-chain amino acid transport system substrate-binding protein
MAWSRSWCVRLGVLALGSALVACSAGTDRADAPCDTSRGSLVIGVIAPLSGDLSSLGLGIRNAADLAVDQAVAACRVPGYALRLQVEDDEGDAEVATLAAERLAADPAVVGVIGTLNSSTAQAVQPVLDRAGIVQVSPANTSPMLSLGTGDTPQRPFATYFRLATTDLQQGAFAARHLVEVEEVGSIAVVDDGKAYGAGLADEFVREAEALGARVVGRQQVDEQDSDFSEVVGDVQAWEPEALFYGGEYAVAARLSKQIADAGLDVPLMGGDGIHSSEYIALGGRPGDLATALGAPVADLESAQPFVAAYTAANYPEPFETYGVLSYDATTVLLDALARTVTGGGWDVDRRADLVAAVQATDLAGAGGQVRFDDFGDTTNRVLTVYTVRDGDFVPLRTGEAPSGAGG